MAKNILENNWRAYSGKRVFPMKSLLQMIRMMIKLFLQWKLFVFITQAS